MHPPRTRYAPSPLVGEGWGGGSLLLHETRPPTPTPTPNPSPAGCGLARFRQILSDQTPAGRGLVGEGRRPSPPRRDRPKVAPLLAKRRIVGAVAVGICYDSAAHPF